MGVDATVYGLMCRYINGLDRALVHTHWNLGSFDRPIGSALIYARGVHVRGTHGDEPLSTYTLVEPLKPFPDNPQPRDLCLVKTGPKVSYSISDLVRDCREREFDVIETPSTVDLPLVNRLKEFELARTGEELEAGNWEIYVDALADAYCVKFADTFCTSYDVPLSTKLRTSMYSAYGWLLSMVSKLPFMRRK